MKHTDITLARLDAAAKAIAITVSRTPGQAFALTELVCDSENAMEYVYVALSSIESQYSSAQVEALAPTMATLLTIGIEIGRRLEGFAPSGT